MKQYEFRVWDTKTNKYFYPWPQGFSLFGEVTCFDCIGQQFERNENRLMRYNDLVIEQYICMHDKNNKEIFEGDLVEIDCNIDVGHTDERIERTVFVVAVDSIDEFLYNHVYRFCQDCCVYPPHKYKGSIYDYYKERRSRDFRIVGNKHENPELYKKVTA